MTFNLSFLDADVVLAIHQESLATFGGKGGLRDLGLLESALARPKQHQNYRSALSIFEMAAIYCEGLVKNHPFTDGNKRIGFLCAFTFLELNGYDFNPPEASIVAMMESLASGKLSLQELTRWIADYSIRIE